MNEINERGTIMSTHHQPVSGHTKNRALVNDIANLTVGLLEEMTDAYLTCGLWASLDMDLGPLDEHFDIGDCVNREDAEREIRDFVSGNVENLAAIIEAGASVGQIGHDFLLSRDRHGTGFWDRGYGSIGQILHEAATVYGDSGFMAEGCRDAILAESELFDGGHETTEEGDVFVEADLHLYVVDLSKGFRVTS